MTKVGIVGVGTMGASFARYLVRSGVDVLVHDVRSDATARAKEAGAAVAGDVADLAGGCDVVLVSLPGPREVTAVLLTEGNGVLGNLTPQAVCVNTSTIGPACARELAHAFAAKGRAFVDAPVSGRPPDMVVFASGSLSGFATARPMLDLISSEVQWLGEPGAASLVKVLSQYITYVAFVATTEAMLVGEKAGLPATKLAKAFATSSAHNRMIGAAAEAARERRSDHWGTVGIIAKDLHLVRDTVRALAGNSLPIADICSRYFDEAAVTMNAAPFPFVGDIIRTAVLDVTEQ